MELKTRPELSKRNKYWIERHRYYELKHFCLQYPIWKNAYNSLDGLSKQTIDMMQVSNHEVGDPTVKAAELRLYFKERMAMVEEAARKADSELSEYLIKAVSENLGYTYLETKLDIPCGKDTYYERYRKFFWLLDKIRN